MYSKVLFLGFCAIVLAAPTPSTGSGSGRVVTAKIDDDLYAIVEIPVQKREAVPTASKTSNLQLAVPVLRKARAAQPSTEPIVTATGSGKLVTVKIDDDLAGIVEINGDQPQKN